MALDLTLIKQHPYATGGVVIVGGLVAFYLLSSAQGGGAQASSSGGMSAADYQAYLQAQSSIAQANSAAQVQTNAQQVQLQQAQLEAQVANGQTAASIQNNNVSTAATLAATLAQIQAQTQQNSDSLTAQTVQNRDMLTAQTAQQANQLTYAQNIQQMQDDVLSSQINAGVAENANNNATALASTISSNDLQSLIAKLSASTATTIAGYQAQVASQGVDAATQVQLAALGQQYNLSKQTLDMVQQAGLNHGTASLENALVATIGTALGYPQVGVAGVQGATQASVASSASTASIVNSIASGVSNVVGSLFKVAA
jgi:hypothetical protein